MLAGKAEDLGACVQSCAAVCPRPQASLDIQAGEYLDLPAPEGGHSSYPPTPGPWSVGRRESTLWPGPQRAAAGPGLVPLTFTPQHPRSSVCRPQRHLLYKSSWLPLVENVPPSVPPSPQPLPQPFLLERGLRLLYLSLWEQPVPNGILVAGGSQPRTQETLETTRCLIGLWLKI